MLEEKSGYLFIFLNFEFFNHKTKCAKNIHDSYIIKLQAFKKKILLFVNRHKQRSVISCKIYLEF